MLTNPTCDPTICYYNKILAQRLPNLKISTTGYSEQIEREKITLSSFLNIDKSINQMFPHEMMRIQLWIITVYFVLYQLSTFPHSFIATSVALSFYQPLCSPMCSTLPSTAWSSPTVLPSTLSPSLPSNTQSLVPPKGFLHSEFD